MEFELKQESELEKLMFDATKESVAKVIEIIKKSKIDNEFLWRMYVHAGKIRRFSYSTLSDIASFLKHPKYLFEKTDFLVYLLKKSLIDESFLTDTVISNVEKQGVQRIENIYPPDSLIYAILHDNIERVVFESTKPGFFTEQVKFIDKRIEYINIAAFAASVKVFKFLMLNGSSISEKTCKFSVEGGSLEISEICAQRNISMKRSLSKAIKYHRNDIAKWIVDEYDFTDKDLACCVSCFNTEMFFYMFPRSLNIDALGSNQRTLLMLATINGNREMVNFLLKEKANINATDVCGESAIIFAIRNMHNDIVKSLVMNGADLSVTDEDEFTPIFTALRKSNYDALKILVENGADINSVDHDTSLIAYAAMNNAEDIVKYLIDKGANVDNCLFGFRGEMSLITYYTSKNNEKMVKYLNEKGIVQGESDPDKVVPKEMNLYEKAMSYK